MLKLFQEKTLKMKTKKIQIADLKVGDKIKTKSTTGEIIFRLVTDVMDTIVEEENQVRLEFENGVVLNCSINHPIMVLEQHTGNYVEKLPLLLSQTDLVITESGFTRILTMDTNQRNNVNYIDITVGDTHTFFASAFEEGQMILTHNSQGGVRNGSATLAYPVWHLEVEDLLVLKNNKGTEDNRIRHMDYSVQFNKVMYERLLSGGNITLLSPSDVPGLYEAFFADQDLFRKLYEAAEANPATRKKTLRAVDLISQFAQERKDTGRIYLQNVDHANSHSPFDPTKAPIRQSNLCQEINLPTKPLTDVNDPAGEIALCTLSAINWGMIRTPEDFAKPCELAVRALDALLTYQHYPVPAAKNSTDLYRPLGIGIINFAYWLAKNDYTYTDSACLPAVDQYMEAMSYYLIKTSIELAKEFGPCAGWQNLRYAQGIVPVDTRKAEVDELVPYQERQDWQSLRTAAAQYGIRNSTLMALMPSETSSQVSNSTNGIEPVRSLISVKQSKHGVLKQVVPEMRKLKNRYELLWNQASPEGYLKICSVLQKWIDQGISVNTSYNPAFYPDEKIPMSELLKHILMFYRYGGKQLYYNNTHDGQGEINVEKMAEPVADCESCVI